MAERKLVTGRQMDRWVRDFDNWDICDGTCCHLFVFAEPAWRKANSGPDGKKNSRKGQASRWPRFWLATIRKRLMWGFVNIEGDRARSVGRAEFCKESRELGTAKHREAKPGIESSGNRERKEDSGTELACGTLDCRGCVAGTEERSGADAVAPTRCMRRNGGKKKQSENTQGAYEAMRREWLSFRGQLGYPTPTKEMAKRLKCVLHDRDGACFVAETKEQGIAGWVHVSTTPLMEVEAASGSERTSG